MKLSFRYKELMTKYPDITYRGFTRWAYSISNAENASSRYDIYICGLLMSDYQDSGDCHRMLLEIDKVEKGEIVNRVGSGNAWTTTVTKSGVQIDHHTVSDWDEQAEGWFSLSEFKAALEGWKRFLEMPARLDSVVEINI